MSALMALEDADLGAVPPVRIRRAANQMGVAAAFAATKRFNKNLFLDDEGTFLHSPAPNPRRSPPMRTQKGAEFGPRWRDSEKTVQKQKNGTESASS
jgi:hypothetical protein